MGSFMGNFIASLQVEEVEKNFCAMNKLNLLFNQTRLGAKLSI